MSWSTASAFALATASIERSWDASWLARIELRVHQAMVPPGIAANATKTTKSLIVRLSDSPFLVRLIGSPHLFSAKCRPRATPSSSGEPVTGFSPSCASLAMAASGATGLSAVDGS